jgi:AcrR family transcriptional regulator
MDRKEQILELATEMFGREGYDKVTVKRLADACGVTEPAIYRHFKSKEAIYLTVLESLKGRLDYRETFSLLENEPDVEVLLKTLAAHIIDFYTENADIYRLLLFAALRGHDKAKRIFDVIRGTYVRFLIKQLDRLFEEKHIIKKNNEITARCFIGMVFDCSLGMTLWKGMQGKAYDPTEIIANNVPIYSRGLKRE